ncbi:MAG TPA: XRE family transcriptional regulator [Candidatus Dormibacteraeota bacterium]|nr:XRE family transcriptional regulator [Candidatus Dormibacteraeota bacterium]
MNEIIRKLGRTERKRIQQRAAELIAEEMSLRDLRKARKLTQARIAKTLGITQDSVSRLEQRSDLLLSTLRKTVKAMGGDVRIVAEFPDRSPVVISDLSGQAASGRASRRRRPTKRIIKRAQRLIRKHVKPGVSLADELIAERSEAARKE